MRARRPWAWPLVPVYGAALAAKDAMRAAGVLRERSLAWPVISVGSLSVGGAGKTPVVIALAKLLTERGWLVDVLSRGYGRSSKGVEQVDAQAEDGAQRFGDEPVLIAERTGVPVWVGASRFAAGRAAEINTASLTPAGRLPGAERRDDGSRDTSPICAHILDDGMQHRGLGRQFELVVATEEDLKDTLLPAGNLREPLMGLRRADAVVVREDELDKLGKRLRALSGTEVPLWTVRRTLHFPSPLGVFGAGLRPLAFCALARPEDFAAMLASAGCGVVDTLIFPDHHRYGERDLTLLVSTAKKLKATGLVTSEKDAVKLSAAMRTRLEAEIGPVMVVRLQVNFVYESPVVRALGQRIRATGTENAPQEARVR